MTFSSFGPHVLRTTCGWFLADVQTYKLHEKQRKPNFESVLVKFLCRFYTDQNVCIRCESTIRQL